MNRRTFVGLMVVSLTATLTLSGLLASSIAFRLQYDLKQVGAGSKSGTSTLALLDNPQAGLTTSKLLMDDIGFAQTANVAKFVKSSDGFQTYTGRKGSPGADFSLAAGEGYFVKMNTTVSYLVTGTDNPAITYNLKQQDGGVTSKTGSNLFAYNYHQTATTSKQLMDDIGFAQTANVGKFLAASDGFQTYTGRKGTPGADFTLRRGEAYFIKMNTTVNYSPSHY